MAVIDSKELAQHLYTAHLQGQAVATRPTATDQAFDLPAAYTVLHEIVSLVRQDGWQTVGRKIGLTNRATWGKLNIDTPVWGYVFDKTVHYLTEESITFSLKNTVAPRIEPEIVFKLKTSPALVNTSAAEVLEAVEWIAPGFEIVDCPFPNWDYLPADLVADWGFHSALLIGQPQPLVDFDFEEVAQQLANFKLRLVKNGAVAAEGAGKNVVDSPALALGQLIRILHQQDQTYYAPLLAGEVVTTGTITIAQDIKPGEEWSTEVEGLNLPALRVRFTE